MDKKDHIFSKLPGWMKLLLAGLIVLGSALGILPQTDLLPAEQTSQEPAAIVSETQEEESLTFRNQRLLQEHYEKHGKEMGFSTAEEYEQAAAAVVQNPDVLHKTEKEDGDDVYYLEATNEFVIVSVDGYLRTYFLPGNGMDYFQRQ